MKVWINIIAILAFIGTLVVGKMYWNEKTSAETTNKPIEVASTSKVNSKENWKDYTKNLSRDISEKLTEAEKAGTPLKVLMVGSQDTSTDSNAWPALMEKELLNTYGSNLVDIEVQEYAGMTTLEFIRSEAYTSIIKSQPDVLIFEPFLANDNGVVGITNTLENISIIMARVEKEVDGLTTIIQPSHPIYNAVNYPKEASQLEAFADEQGYAYVNHWTKWPEASSDELLNYLTEEKDAPSNQGNKAWAEAMVSYWVSK